MNPLAFKIGMATLCYDVAHYELYCQSLIPGGDFHSRLTDTDYFGFVDDKQGTAHAFIRGTKGWLAWLRNFLASDSDQDGAADGFEMSAELFVKTFMGSLSHFDNINFYTHSAGSAIGPIVAAEMKSTRPNIKIRGDGFCSPPPGNDQFAAYFKTFGIHWMRWEMVGDPINTRILRNKKSAVFDGVDVGERFILPVASQIQRIPVLRINAHSPKMVCRAGIKLAPKDKKDFQWVRERCIN